MCHRYEPPEPSKGQKAAMFIAAVGATLIILCVIPLLIPLAFIPETQEMAKTTITILFSIGFSLFVIGVVVGVVVDWLYL